MAEKSKGRGHGLAFVAVLVLVTGAALLGGRSYRQRAADELAVASSEGSPSQSSDAPVRSRDRHFAFDAGRVFFGDVAAHEFLLTNDTGRRLSLQSDGAIHKTCGCATIEPSARSLEPRAATRVKVTVQTGGRYGPFAQGGSIVWTDAQGATLTTHFQVRGTAAPALRCEPSILAFDERQVLDSAPKELVLTSDFPVAWDAVTMVASCPEITIADRAATGDGLRCLVRCSVPDDREEVNGTVHVRATVPSGKTNTGPHETTLVVPVQARRQVDLAISPPVLLVRFDSQKRRATTTAIIRGKAL